MLLSGWGLGDVKFQKPRASSASSGGVLWSWTQRAEPSLAQPVFLLRQAQPRTQQGRPLSYTLGPSRTPRGNPPAPHSAALGAPCPTLSLLWAAQHCRPPAPLAHARPCTLPATRRLHPASSIARGLWEQPTYPSGNPSALPTFLPHVFPPCSPPKLPLTLPAHWGWGWGRWQENVDLIPLAFLSPLK